MEKEERMARIRELLGSAMPGGGVSSATPTTVVVNVLVGSRSKKCGPVSH